MTEAERRGAPVILPSGARFVGLLTFRGAAVVEGDLEGEILAEGTLVLGPDARVEARIEVDQLISSGVASGEIVARKRIELNSTAVVRGVLRTPRLTVADGCLVEARCHTGELSQPSESAENSSPPAA